LHAKTDSPTFCSNTLVANVYIAVSGSQLTSTIRTYSNIVGACRVRIGCEGANGNVGRARRIVLERILAIGCVLAAGSVVLKCIQTICRVADATCVRSKSVDSHSNVAATSRVTLQSVIAEGAVVLAAGIANKAA
jgi:hypothetical protein